MVPPRRTSRTLLVVIVMVLSGCGSGKKHPTEPSAHPLTGVVVREHLLSDRPFGLSLTPTGDVYVTRLDAATVTQLHLQQETATHIAVGAVPTDVTAPAGSQRRFVANQLDGSIGVIQGGVHSESISVLGDPFRVRSSPDGQHVYALLNNGRLYAINTATGAKTDSVNLLVPLNGLAFHPTEPRIYASSFTDNRVFELDGTSLTVLREIVVSSAPQDMVVSPEGDELYVATSTGVRVVRLSDGMSLTTFPSPNAVFGLAMTPDGTRLVASVPLAGVVQILDRANQTLLETVQTGGQPRRLAVSADNSMVVVANEQGWVTFID